VTLRIESKLAERRCGECGAFLPEGKETCHKCGWNLAQQKEEPKAKTVRRQVCRIIRDDFIAEEVFDPPNPPQFVVHRFKSGDEFDYVDELDLGETDYKGRKVIFVPVFNDHVRKGMVILPRRPVSCTIPEVVNDAFLFVLSGFDPCGKVSDLQVVVLTSILSWFLDKERPSVPIAGIGVFAAIIAIRGPSGSGKNRLANLLRFLSYHPFFDVSTYRIPSLYRPLDIWKGSLVMDEADFGNTNENSQLTHFLNSRATGTPIGHQNPERPSQCDAFESFGLTIVTQRRHFDDKATEGRTVPHYTDVSEDRSLPTLETEAMVQRGLTLQDKLLYIRLKYWQALVIDKTRWIDGVTDHRLNSTLLPILALSAFCPELFDIVMANITSIEKARRKLKSQSEDGVVINALWERVESELFGTHNNLYYIGETKEQYHSIDGETHERVIPLTTSKLADSMRFSPKTIRKIITSINIVP
jgi:hypothetical protein